MCSHGEYNSGCSLYEVINETHLGYITVIFIKGRSAPLPGFPCLFISDSVIVAIIRGDQGRWELPGTPRLRREPPSPPPLTIVLLPLQPPGHCHLCGWRAGERPRSPGNLHHARLPSLKAGSFPTGSQSGGGPGGAGFSGNLWPRDALWGSAGIKSNQFSSQEVDPKQPSVFLPMRMRTGSQTQERKPRSDRWGLGGPSG